MNEVDLKKLSNLNNMDGKKLLLHFCNDIKRDDILISNIVKALKNIKNLVELTITIEYYLFNSR